MATELICELSKNHGQWYYKFKYPYDCKKSWVLKLKTVILNILKIMTIIVFPHSPSVHIHFKLKTSVWSAIAIFLRIDVSNEFFFCDFFYIFKIYNYSDSIYEEKNKTESILIHFWSSIILNYINLYNTM